MFWNNIHEIDQLLTLEINSWNSFITDPVWQFFSAKLVWAPMYAAIIALLIWKLGWKRGLVAVGAALLTFVFCDQFANLVKAAVGRIRPLHDTFMVDHGLHILERGGGLSFFSAHAANAFGLATCTYFGLSRLLAGNSEAKPKWLKAYGIWMFIWAVLVAISRIFVGKHYLGDVMVGALVGALAGYAFARLACCIASKLKS
jgi:undecaprenyl-diphosphatase